MTKLAHLSFIILLGLGLFSCQTNKDLPTYTEEQTWKTKDIKPTPQPKDGNAEAGYQYMIYGDFIGSGTPYEVMKNRMLKKPDTILARTAENTNAFFWGNVFETRNNVKVFAGNCFTCHASELNGKMILGLGNAFSDFTKSQTKTTRMLRTFVKLKYRQGSPEREAFQPYAKSIKILPKYILTNNVGVNPAFRLEEACTIYRNPVDLKQRKSANFKPIDYTFASDVPPLWLLKKKNALYYNGMGRGSMTKLLMQASVLGIPDSSQARKVHENFNNVLTWIKSLTPPPYPKPINEEKAKRGLAVYENTCSECHGSYGRRPSYPNRLVALHIIKTDPFYALYFSTKSHLAEWYNQSWFATSTPQSSLQPEDAYIAPPLDGIWASAPYLHNGSVPDLESLMNSQLRPKYWQKVGGKSNYDFEKTGLKYVAKTEKGKNTYDTTLLGYGNDGHTFGDKLTPEERSDLIEFLKKL